VIYVPPSQIEYKMRSYPDYLSICSLGKMKNTSCNNYGDRSMLLVFAILQHEIHETRCKRKKYCPCFHPNWFNKKSSMAIKDFQTFKDAIRLYSLQIFDPTDRRSMTFGWTNLVEIDANILYFALSFVQFMLKCSK
jgi:hypothetical protein